MLIATVFALLFILIQVVKVAICVQDLGWRDAIKRETLWIVLTVAACGFIFIAAALSD